MIRAALLSIVCLALTAPLSAEPRKVAHNGPQAVQKRAQVRDLPAIRSSKVLRVLVNQSRNSSGDIKGQEVGVEYERLQAFEKHLNGQRGGKVTFKIIPKAKSQLLAALLRGEGDLIAPGELLETAGKGVSASRPIVADVALVVVTGRGQRSFKHIEQLSGRTLSLPAGSVADAAVHDLNLRLAQRKLAPVHIEWVDPSLSVEDVLEMVQAGIYPLTLVEQPIAERWARVMPKLRVERNLKLESHGNIGWFVREDAPLLQASINGFLATYKAPANQDLVFEKAFKKMYRVNNPLARSNLQRLHELRPILQRHGDAHGIDWLDLAALAFKESKLDTTAKGSGGATGLLQITPSAARRVGVNNIHTADGNVQAAARYMALIQRKFFASPQINERERMAFVLAAYNLGPERVQSMRQEARKRGLNPNQWFFQTERIAMEQKGAGVVTFVNSVNKYYLAFDRQRDALERGPGARKYVTRN
ncbi:transglycosylase SLT domain-containing protein [Pseudomonas sp. LJDD11]|uniref:transglycosylase SLT domain-containing protein n=1 Tax=unclassified Pseudomonas TaxID=196821 RepID=UPI0004F6DB1D|nr:MULTISPECIES: transglycosylase SLT domain-containing protein [unclassified Pseudomonas]MCQ9425521.1 transglycosylase SLT domain-containing protein [Pseudomonas sp. LJDD11]BAP45564.1 transglycosylase, SLT family protein [Pseudomonas sp. StFLB209]